MDNWEYFLRKIERLFKESNLLITNKREYILKVLYESDFPLDVVSMQEKVKVAYNVDITTSAIYNFVESLQEMQVVSMIHLPPYGTRYYSIKFLKSHSYLVCNHCGKIVLFSDKQMEKSIKKELTKKDFLLTHHRILLYGICKDCLNE